MATTSISDLDYECPVCLEKILPPVYQCVNGHILCETCQEKVSHCPVCRKKFLNNERIRCLEVERIIEMQEHSCPHVKKGCTLRLKWNEIREHELDCLFASLHFCHLMGIGNCSATVPKQELLNHFALFHNNDVVCNVWEGYVDTPYNVTMILPRANSMVTEYVAFCAHEPYYPVMFVLAIIYAEGRVSWVPYILGSKKAASFYGCQIRMGRAVEPMCTISWSGPVVSIGNKTVDESGLSLNLPETTLHKISTFSDANHNACYQIQLSFHRNPSAQAMGSPHTKLSTK